VNLVNTFTTYYQNGRVVKEVQHDKGSIFGDKMADGTRVEKFTQPVAWDKKVQISTGRLIHLKGFPFRNDSRRATKEELAELGIPPTRKLDIGWVDPYEIELRFIDDARFTVYKNPKFGFLRYKGYKRFEIDSGDPWAKQLGIVPGYCLVWSMRGSWGKIG